MTAFLLLFAAYTVGVLVGWLARSHRAHVLRRRQLLAAELRPARPQATADARWDAVVEASLPPELRRRSTST